VSAVEAYRPLHLAVDTAGRVARGARWLDARRPGWRADVAPGALSMSDPRACILGQVARQLAGEADLDVEASFFSIVDCGDLGEVHPCVLALLGAGRGRSKRWAQRRGFEVADGETYADLEREWRRVLAGG
jgi:hypothetical protein